MQLNLPDKSYVCIRKCFWCVYHLGTLFTSFVFWEKYFCGRKAGFSTEVCGEPKGCRYSEPLLISCLYVQTSTWSSYILVDLHKENIIREKWLGVLSVSLQQGEPRRDQAPDLFQLCCSPLAAFHLESSGEGEHTRRHRSPLELVMGNYS